MSHPPELYKEAPKTVALPAQVEKPKLKTQQPPAPSKGEKRASRPKKDERRQERPVHYVEPHF